MSTLPLSPRPLSPLRAIEIEGKRKAIEGARCLPNPSFFRVALISFLVTPFALMELLFVPLLGLFLTAAVIWCGISYLVLLKSKRLFLAALIGAALSFASIAISSDFLRVYGEFPMYIMLGLGTAVMFTCWVWFAALKHMRLEAGSLVSAGV